ncbi:aromatic acid exporter family protein [Peptacetobacter hominis]|uniref:Aromatic acid exporter family protein n=1 Tax=Peptacetobacter hominis TaxID=2743610 RepID=A0A544QXU9_9FIRM|nr:aromatic acid exporter family protein [Peptacetobacter hominis]TQQ85483.1 aromatic acid exporter family protein [Peptacetobacter hominis]
MGLSDIRLPKIGMRAIKTGIVVMITILITKNFVQYPFYAAIAGVISLQDTVTGSVKAGMNRIKGTVVGGIMGFIFALIMPGNPILCGIGVILTIYVCNILKITSISVSCVVFLAIHLGVGSGDPMSYSIHRVLDTSVGVIIAVVINYVIARPDHVGGIKEEYIRIVSIGKKLFRDKIVEHKNIDIEKYKKELYKMENIYNKIRSEKNYNGENPYLEEMDDIEVTRHIIREIYFHLQIISHMEQKDELFLTNENYLRLEKLYYPEEIIWEIDEEKSPVFNYNIDRILDSFEDVDKILENNMSM